MEENRGEIRAKIIDFSLLRNKRKQVRIDMRTICEKLKTYNEITIKISIIKKYSTILLFFYVKKIKN